MSQNLEHFQLIQWQSPIRHQKHGGGRSRERESRAEHGETLLTQIGEVREALKERVKYSPKSINPSLVFKIKLEDNLKDEKIEALGLKILARNSSGLVVVFPSEETLGELRRRVNEYSGKVVDGSKYNEIASISAILDLTADDRVGQKLKEQPLASDEIAAVDIQLFHFGDKNVCYEKIEEIQAYLTSRNAGLRVTDRYVGEYLCLVRARLDAEALQVITNNTDYVMEVDRRSKPTYEALAVVKTDFTEPNNSVILEKDAKGILVIDSGIMGQHPILGTALDDAQVFLDKAGKIKGGPEDGDEKQGGHGTAVAGIAAFNDIGQCIKAKEFHVTARIFSARVTDENNEYSEEELLQHQLEDALNYFLTTYDYIKVINISHGDNSLVCGDSKYQFRFAAAVDELAYRYRDKEIIFVVSAGNFFPSDLTNEQIKMEYPKYLLEKKAARIIDPATSAIALTVGGLSYGYGKDINNHFEMDVVQPIAKEKYWPSSFTRTGLGFNDAIKPDVVDFAGDYLFKRGSLESDTAGIPTTNKNFVVPGSRLFTLVSGTSFAAPRVANLAARLFREFPSASSNLVRALIADSARVPTSRPEIFSGKKHWEDADVLRVYGYGQPDFDRARTSEQNRILLVEDKTIELDSFILYEIPSLHPDFLKVIKNNRKAYLSVSLAFDPPTRITRADSYLGVTMEYALFRNVATQQLYDALKYMSPEEKEDLENNDLPSLKKLRKDNSLPIKIDLKPGSNIRKRGTLQKGICQISQSSWKYDSNPLVLAVMCNRKWATTITTQRFAVVVSIQHDDPLIDLHSDIKQRNQNILYNRQRIRV